MTYFWNAKFPKEWMYGNIGMETMFPNVWCIISSQTLEVTTWYTVYAIYFASLIFRKSIFTSG